MHALLPLLLAVAPVGAPQVSRPPGVDRLDAVLRAVVRDGLVDYVGLRHDHWNELQGFLDAAAAFDPDELPRDQARKAFLIDLYNATMLGAVARRLSAGWTPAADDFSVFHEPLVRLAGGRLSLDSLENDLLRRRFADPRLHVALVCAARSCPPLRPFSYSLRGGLDAVLDENMERFLHDPSRNRIDRERRTARLSRIFDWYAEDFGGRDRVLAFVGERLGEDLSGYSLDFLDYDWTLNARAPDDGSARALVRDVEEAGLAVGEVVRLLGEADGRARVAVFGRGEAEVPSDALSPWP